MHRSSTAGSMSEQTRRSIAVYRVELCRIVHQVAPYRGSRLQTKEHTSQNWRYCDTVEKQAESILFLPSTCSLVHTVVCSRSSDKPRRASCLYHKRQVYEKIGGTVSDTQGRKHSRFPFPSRPQFPVGCLLLVTTFHAIRNSIELSYAGAP